MALLPPLASLAALDVRIPGGIASADEARAEAALDDASALIRHVAGTTWTDDSDALEDVPAVVEAISLQVARRGFLNPDGYAQKSVDDVSVTYARDAASGDGIYLTESERAQVLAAVGSTRTGLWSLRTTRGVDNDDQYLPVAGQDEPMPFLPAGE